MCHEELRSFKLTTSSTKNVTRRKMLTRQRLDAMFRPNFVNTIILLTQLCSLIHPGFCGLSENKTFIDDMALHRCLSNLQKADTDNNNEIFPNEFVKFIDLESNDGGGPNCCVGRNAKIDISRKNGRPVYTQTLCWLIDTGIYDLLNSTPNPAPPTSLMPSRSPVLYGNPSTLSPSQSPMKPPAPPPISLLPTESPTLARTESPSKMPTRKPVARPSFVPTTLRPTFPTSSTACVNFGYGLQNEANLTAYDILHMVNNSLRKGLIIATRNVTIEILNETFPRSTSVGSATQSNASQSLLEKFLELMQASSPEVSTNSTSHSDGNRRTLQERARSIDFAMEHALIDIWPRKNIKRLIHDEMKGLCRWRINNAGSPAKAKGDTVDTLISEGSRRLVYYSDMWPVEITNIVDNPYCGSTPPVMCVIVSTRVCVFLEPGDNATAVQFALYDGFKEAVDNGTLAAAIPPEYIP